MVPKFRAWDKRENTMRDVAVLHFTTGGKVNYIEYWKTPSELKSYHARNVILMQSTGLKDKNGVEIFEGDVIFYAYFETNANNRLIKFVNGQFIAELIRNGYHKSLINVIDDAEIIGNICEHPELLEVK
jgi:uncharacterized phage protein (TIGR01671 family)